MRKGAPVGPSPNTYPPAPAPELAWCNTVAWIVGGIFAAMFVIWIALELVTAVGRWRSRRRASRFVVGFDPARDGAGTVVLFDPDSRTVVESWEVRSS
jgi:hypothetical protein